VEESLWQPRGFCQSVQSTVPSRSRRWPFAVRVHLFGSDLSHLSGALQCATSWGCRLRQNGQTDLRSVWGEGVGAGKERFL
jgi:hypothetical protein